MFCSLDSSYPFLAVLIAGFRTSSKGRLPYLSSKYPNTAGVDGTVVALMPFLRGFLLKSPKLIEYGALEDPSTAIVFFSFSPICKSAMLCPPRPEACGSVTPRQNAAATAASTAFPPISSISAPALVA